MKDRKKVEWMKAQVKERKEGGKDREQRGGVKDERSDGEGEGKRGDRDR